MRCRWAKGSIWEGQREACANPEVHSTRCYPDDCPFAREMQGAEALKGESGVGVGRVAIDDLFGQMFD